MRWHTEKRKVSELIPYSSNPRQMTKKQNEDLTKSLEKFDLVEIPAINQDRTILAGHQRLRIMQALGRGDEEIDVRVPNRQLTEKEVQEYNIRSNKNTGEFDFDMLANSFEVDDLLEWGFEEKDLKIETEVEEDEVPEVSSEPAISKLGDIYKLGNHRLMCGDSTKIEDVEKLMGGGVSKMLFTSPPYNINSGMYETYTDNLKSQEYIDFNLDVINVWKKYLKGFLFWNISYNKNARWEFIEIMYRIIKETGLQFLELIVWDKGHALPITAKGQLTRQYEDVLMAGDEETVSKELDLFATLSNQRVNVFNKRTGKGVTNYWRIDTSGSQLENHLACYPVKLPAKAILLMTAEKDIVIDPFCGSGTTVIASEQLNRICYGMELDPKYIDVIIKRWENLTGKKAEKINE